MVCRGADGDGRIVRFGRRIDLRRWYSDQLFGARNVCLAGGTGEQSVVADAMSAEIGNRNCPESSIMSGLYRVYDERTVYNYPQLCYIIHIFLRKQLSGKDDADRQIECPQGGDGEAG